MFDSLSTILYLIITCVVPVLTVWGWIRWARRIEQPRTPSSYLSLIGFGLSTISTVLAVGGVFYAHQIGGFRHYDPVLIDIYGAGLLLSLGGLACALIGLLKPNPLRWHAPLCALGMFIFWLLSAVQE